MEVVLPPEQGIPMAQVHQIYKMLSYLLCQLYLDGSVPIRVNMRAIRLCLLVAFFWNFFGIFFALTTSCRFARAYRSRTNLITKHSSLDLFYQ